jgi:hypothetical protein
MKANLMIKKMKNLMYQEELAKEGLLFYEYNTFYSL